MQSIVASVRALLGGWILAVAVPSLTDSSVIAEWANAGWHDGPRMSVVVAELLGAVLFAFEPAVVVGFALLLASFVAATALHVHMGRVPWHLAFYALAAALLLHFTRRARHVTSLSKFPTATPADR